MCVYHPISIILTRSNSSARPSPRIDRFPFNTPNISRCVIRIKDMSRNSGWIGPHVTMLVPNCKRPWDRVVLVLHNSNKNWNNAIQKRWTSIRRRTVATASSKPVVFVTKQKPTMPTIDNCGAMERGLALFGNKSRCGNVIRVVSNTAVPLWNAPFTDTTVICRSAIWRLLKLQRRRRNPRKPKRRVMRTTPTSFRPLWMRRGRRCHRFRAMTTPRRRPTPRRDRKEEQVDIGHHGCPPREIRHQDAHRPYTFVHIYFHHHQ